MFIGVQILAAVSLFIAGVVNLIFPIFGESSAMTTFLMYSLAVNLANSARIDMIKAKPRINITIVRDNSDNKG